jgi:flagellar hook-associated protein 3 FlgL
MMYSSFVRDMNRTLSDYMESNMQATSEKRINRPSDDPVGAGRILASRATLGRIDTYQDNVNTALGWLSTADSVLASGEGSVQSLISDIRGLALQAATGTVTAENRLQISQQVRGLLSQLVSLSNSTYAGSHIFAGHKTTEPAYVEGLAVSVHGENMEDYKYVDFAVPTLNGASLPSRVVSFVPVQGGGGTIGTADYYYTTDGGKSWQHADPPITGQGPYGNACSISGGGVTIYFSDENVDVAEYYNQPGGGEPELNDQSSLDKGSWFCVRPTAIYLGDDNDTQVTQTYTPSNPGNPPGTFTTTASGYFARDVAVRLDRREITVGTPGTDMLYYSYSVDDGSNWTQTSIPMPTGDFTLPVPGGSLQITGGSLNIQDPPVAGGPSDAGTQFIIHPHRADVDLQIGEDSRITVNMVGKDVFGGIYNYPGDKIKWSSSGYTPPPPGGYLNRYPIRVGSEQPYYNDNIPNLFESVGELICALECNSQHGVQMSLDKLDAVMNHIMSKAGEIGGRENRVTATQSSLIMRKFSEEDHLSQIEDIDLTELMTKLAQQQTAYQAVLKSSSMIMQMGLVNFL